MQAYEYLNHRLGVNKVTANTFLKALAEFIIFKLLKELPARLYCIGEFSAVNDRVKFSPGFNIKRKLSRNRPRKKDWMKVLRDIRQDLGLEEFTESVETEEGIEPFKRVNSPVKKIRWSLLLYLHRHYCHGASWKHPYTKVIYEWHQVTKAIKIVKALNSDKYKVLLSVWISIEARAELLERWGMDAGEYKHKAEDMLDAIIIALEAPELIEEEILSLNN